MPRPSATITRIGTQKVRLHLLRRKERTADGLWLPDHADAATYFEGGVLSVVVRAHCFAYRRRMRQLLVHEAIHCAEYMKDMEDFDIPKDCSYAATVYSLAISQFLENLPIEWKRAAGLL